MFDVTAVADRAEAHLRRHRLPHQPREPAPDRHGAVPVRRMAARQLHPHEEVRRLLEAGPALSGRASSTASCRTARAARSRCRPARCSDARPTTSSRSTCRASRRSRTCKWRLHGWEYSSPVMWVEINHRVKPLDDVRVRQAISHALDRNFILQPPVVRHRQGGDRPGRLHHALLRSRTCQAGSLTTRRRPMELLDAAGLKPDAEGRALQASSSLRCPTAKCGRGWPNISAPRWKKVGIEVTLETHRRRRLGAAYRRLGLRDHAPTSCRSTATRRWAWSAPTSPPTSRRSRSPTPAATCNPKVDELFADRAQRRPIRRSRQKAFSAVQEILCEEIPQIWLMEMAWPTIHDKKLHNVITLGTGIAGPSTTCFIG